MAGQGRGQEDGGVRGGKTTVAQENQERVLALIRKYNSASFSLSYVTLI